MDEWEEKEEMMNKFRVLLDMAEIKGRSYATPEVRERLAVLQQANRRVKYKKELFFSYNHWIKDDSQTQIHEKLEKSEEHETVNLRTITNWLRWFRDLPESEVEQDRTGFYFHKMEDYGIPWDKYEDVLQLAEEYAANHNVELTPRIGKWAWRLQQIRKPTFSRQQALQFVGNFVDAELSEVLRFKAVQSLKEVSEDLQLEVSKWQTQPVGTTRRV